MRIPNQWSQWWRYPDYLHHLTCKWNVGCSNPNKWPCTCQGWNSCLIILCSTYSILKANDQKKNFMNLMYTALLERTFLDFKMVLIIISQGFLLGAKVEVYLSCIMISLSMWSMKKLKVLTQLDFMQFFCLRVFLKNCSPKFGKWSTSLCQDLWRWKKCMLH